MSRNPRLLILGEVLLGDKVQTSAPADVSIFIEFGLVVHETLIP